MGHAIAAAISGALQPQAGPLSWMPPALNRFFGDLARAMFDPYRPELYYMRGPGPAWRKKHEQSQP